MSEEKKNYQKIECLNAICTSEAGPSGFCDECFLNMNHSVQSRNLPRDVELTSLRAQVERLSEESKEVKMLAEQMNQISEALFGYREESFENILGNISHLKHRLEECEKALKPLSEHRYVEDELIKNDVVVFLTVGDCRAARKALEGKG